MRAYKFIFACIVGVYLCNNIGIPVYYHYCGGELESISTLVKTDGCCGDMEEDEDSDCCKNEVKIIAQFNDSYSKTNLPQIKNVIMDLGYTMPYFETNLIKSSRTNTGYLLFKPKIPESGREILHQKSVLII